MQPFRIPLLCLLALSLSIRAADAPATLDGYTAESARTEREWETKFRGLPSPANQREYMRRLTAHPHHVGSPYGKEIAEFMAGLFRSWGYQTEIEQFKVLFPTPK